MSALLILALGLLVPTGVVAFLRRTAPALGAKPDSASVPPDPPSPKHPPEARDLRQVKPGANLRALRPLFRRKEILDRIDDLRLGIVEAHAALVADLPNALDLAAGKLARCRWAAGSAWRRHLAEIGEPDAGALIARALAEDIAPMAGELARRLAAVQSPRMISPDGAPALACDACDKAAMTFGVSAKGVLCSTLSPVNTVALVEAVGAAELVEAIHARNGSGVIQFLTTSGRGCHVYCDGCDRVYCKDHYAIEAKWSGSWHEATDATCPLGHYREIE